MARIRSVKPEFWNDRKLARLTRDARLLYIALWNQSDEHARLHGDARYIKGHCFPYDDDLDLDDIDELLNELERAGRVMRYENDGDPFLFLPTLAKHQRLEAGKQESRLPAPPDEPVPTPPDGKSARDAEKSAESSDSSGEIVAQQVAGSRLQVAGVSASADPPRFDVEGLCRYFASAISKNGVKATVSEKWRTTARLLLDRDGRDPAEIRAVIDWATADTFWRSNVLSVPKFRDKYDQLRLAMERERPVAGGNPATAWAREQG